MYKSKEDKISETVLGEAVLLLLEEQTPITVDTLYQRLQAQLLDERYELRRSGIITALSGIYTLSRKVPSLSRITVTKCRISLLIVK